MAIGDEVDPWEKENEGSAEGPLENVPPDTLLSGIEEFAARAPCEGNDADVLAGLETDSGVVTSCEDDGVA